MTQGKNDSGGTRRRASSIKDELFGDIRARDVPGTVTRDLKALYEFYLSDEERTRLASMGRIGRFFRMGFWILRSLLLKLSPVRRVLLVVALAFFVLGRTAIGIGAVGISTNLRPWGFGILFFVLMFELRDKLLARDEIEVARQVQLALLPRQHPTIPGWSIWGHTQPANDVGGDLLDYIPLDAGNVAVTLGDVAGKGLGAALLMAKLQATLRALAPGCSSLAELGARVNTILYRDGLDNRFATLVCMRVDPGNDRIRVLNAGHNPPLLARAGGIEALPASGRPLGMLPDEDYTEGTCEFAAGDLLFVFSDGLVEARDASDQEFGTARIRRLLPGLRDLTVERAGERLLQEIERFMGGRRPHDDLSMILMKRRAVD